MWWWFSCVRLFVIPWIVARQAPLSIGLFSRHEYWSGLPFPSPGDRPDPGIEPRSPVLQAGSLPNKNGPWYMHERLLLLEWNKRRDSCCFPFLHWPRKEMYSEFRVMEVPFLTSLSRQHRWVEVGNEGWHLSLGSRVSRKRDLDLPG